MAVSRSLDVFVSGMDALDPVGFSAVGINDCPDICCGGILQSRPLSKSCSVTGVATEVRLGIRCWSPRTDRIGIVQLYAPGMGTW